VRTRGRSPVSSIKFFLRLTWKLIKAEERERERHEWYAKPLRMRRRSINLLDKVAEGAEVSARISNKPN
jgi:hypothetical protein